MRLAVLRMTEFAVLIGGLAATIALIVTDRPLAAGFLGVLTAIAYSRFVTRIRRAHFSWISDLLALFGLPLFAYLLLRSRLSYKKGSVAWKGRTYATADATPGNRSGGGAADWLGETAEKQIPPCGRNMTSTG
jgi:hypothetical protein